MDKGGLQEKDVYTSQHNLTNILIFIFIVFNHVVFFHF